MFSNETLAVFYGLAFFVTLIFAPDVLLGDSKSFKTFAKSVFGRMTGYFDFT